MKLLYIICVCSLFTGCFPQIAEDPLGGPKGEKTNGSRSGTNTYTYDKHHTYDGHETFPVIPGTRIDPQPYPKDHPYPKEAAYVHDDDVPTRSTLPYTSEVPLDLYERMYTAVKSNNKQAFITLFQKMPRSFFLNCILSDPGQSISRLSEVEIDNQIEKFKTKQINDIRNSNLPLMIGFFVMLHNDKHKEALNRVLCDSDFKQIVVDFLKDKGEEQKCFLLDMIKKSCEIGKETISFEEMLAALKGLGLNIRQLELGKKGPKDHPYPKEAAYVHDKGVPTRSTLSYTSEVPLERYERMYTAVKSNNKQAFITLLQEMPRPFFRNFILANSKKSISSLSEVEIDRKIEKVKTNMRNSISRPEMSSEYLHDAFFFILCTDKHKEALNMVLCDNDFKHHVVDRVNNNRNSYELLDMIKQFCEICKETIPFEEMLTALRQLGLNLPQETADALLHGVPQDGGFKKQSCA